MLMQANSVRNLLTLRSRFLSTPFRLLSTRTLAASMERALPATFLRGGTSKGIFLNQADLPPSRKDWDPIFLGIMGSPDPEHGRQLDGMGGGVSSLSKICVVKPAGDELRSQLRERGEIEADQVDVEYTFVQVGIRDSVIDYSGNCGNLSSMIGVFALDEGMVKAEQGRTHATVRAFNTNTQKIVSTTFPISIDPKSGSTVADLTHSSPAERTSIAGVPGTHSKVICNYLRPGGARTGKLLPSQNGAPTTQLKVPIVTQTEGSVPGLTATFTASLVDATNPTVFVLRNQIISATHIGTAYTDSPTQFELDTKGLGSALDPAKFKLSEEQLQMLESLRRAGAVAMGLSPSLEECAQAQPKIAMIGAPTLAAEKQDPVDSNAEVHMDIDIIALSMGVPHKAVPMTVGLCLGVAANIQGTLAHEIVAESRRRREVEGARRGSSSSAKASESLIDESDSSSAPAFIRMRHPSGVVDVGARFDAKRELESASVVRTGRRLMKGVVWY